MPASAGASQTWEIGNDLVYPHPSLSLTRCFAASYESTVQVHGPHCLTRQRNLRRSIDNVASERSEQLAAFRIAAVSRNAPLGCHHIACYSNQSIVR